MMTLHGGTVGKSERGRERVHSFLVLRDPPIEGGKLGGGGGVEKHKEGGGLNPLKCSLRENGETISLLSELAQVTQKAFLRARRSGQPVA